MSDSSDESAVCLGCGCLCDDIALSVDEGRINRLVNACPRGEQWFGTGESPADVQIGGRSASRDAALDAAESLLFSNASRTLIYVAGDVTCEGYQIAAALADRLRASIDTLASDTVAEGIFAAQRRGRASATLGELRHRADAVVFWGVDPQDRYPRFLERFIHAPALHVSQRTLIAVDVGNHRGPQLCTERIAVDPANEVDALSVMRAALHGRTSLASDAPFLAVAELAVRLSTTAHYVALIFDAEPTDGPSDSTFAEGLIAFVQQLNSSTRAALFALREGGNRNGSESVLTWQTGYPFAVDFGHGFPRAVGQETTTERLQRSRYAAALVVGSPESLPESVARSLNDIPTVSIGPRATCAAYGPAVAIDTGMAGLHEEGLVLRMDDVPLQPRAVLSHPHSTTEILKRLLERVPSNSEVA